MQRRTSCLGGQTIEHPQCIPRGNQLWSRFEEQEGICRICQKTLTVCATRGREKNTTTGLTHSPTRGSRRPSRPSESHVSRLSPSPDSGTARRGHGNNNRLNPSPMAVLATQHSKNAVPSRRGAQGAGSWRCECHRKNNNGNYNFGGRIFKATRNNVFHL